MTEYIKQKTIQKNSIHNKYQNGSRNYADYVLLKQATLEVSELTGDAKNSYYDKLAYTLTSASPKTNWSVLKAFCNNKKMLLIPPLYIGNKLESDFRPFKIGHLGHLVL